MMCDTIGISLVDCSWTGFSDVNEGEFVLVFMHGHRIVRRESFSMLIGNFDESCLRKKVARANAQFTIDKKTDSVVLRFLQ